MTVSRVTVALDGDVAVAQLHGDVDLTNTALIAGDVLQAVPRGVLGVVIDLTHVRYIDSAGVQMIFELIREHAVRRQGIAFALPEGSPIGRLITITNLNEVAMFRCSAHECAAALRASDPDTF